MSSEQDMRKMGGIWRAVWMTYILMWIGSLALGGIGIPGVYGFAGFYSKDGHPRGGVGRLTRRSAIMGTGSGAGRGNEPRSLRLSYRPRTRPAAADRRIWTCA